jgi:hypothetical protein
LLLIGSSSRTISLQTLGKHNVEATLAEKHIPQQGGEVKGKAKESDPLSGTGYGGEFHPLRMTSLFRLSGNAKKPPSLITATRRFLGQVHGRGDWI